MNEAPALHALARIEQALARIEAAAQQGADLRRRHDELKATVALSLEQIDVLLAQREAK